MRTLRIALLALLVAPLAGASDSDDNAKWQGTWKIVACTFEGSPKTNDVTWTVTGGSYTVRLGQSEETWTFKLDSAAKHVDAVRLGRKLTGIYEVGGSTLKVCYDLTGRRYPQAFDARAGSRQILYEFRRQ